MQQMGGDQKGGATASREDWHLFIDASGLVPGGVIASRAIQVPDMFECVI